MSVSKKKCEKNVAIEKVDSIYSSFSYFRRNTKMIPKAVKNGEWYKFPINDDTVTATEKTMDSGIKNEIAISEIAITNAG